MKRIRSAYRQPKRSLHDRKRTMTQDIAIRQLSLGKVISTGWIIFWNHIGSILPIFLIVFIPINIGLSLIPVDNLDEMHGPFGPKIFSLIYGTSETLLGLLASMALAKLIESSINGKPVTWKQALLHALGRWQASIETAFLVGLIVSVMTLLVIVPGIIWGLYYFFFVFVVGLRGLTKEAAFNYSRDIVVGQWWRVFGYVFVIQLLWIVALGAREILFFLAPASLIVDIIYYTLADTISALFLCMTIVFFLNNDYLKRRSEQSHGESIPDSTLCDESRATHA